VSTQHKIQNREEERLVRKARELLRDSVEDLDAATLSRLNRARHRALEELESGTGSRAGIFAKWVPAGALAAAAVAAVLLWNGQLAPPSAGPKEEPIFTAQDGTIDVATDLDLLLAEESLEMIEDLELFTWMDTDLSMDELQAELGATG